MALEAIRRYMHAMSEVVRTKAKSGVTRKVTDLKAARKTLSKAASTVKPGKVTKVTPATKAAAQIMSAPAGHRIISHREIKKAVEKVFEDRNGTNA